MRSLICIALSLISFCSFGQKEKAYYLIDTIHPDSLAVSDKALLDSLLPIYHKSKNDTVRMGILSELASGMIDEKIWSQYNRLLYKQVNPLYEKINSLSDAEQHAVKKYYAHALQNYAYYIQNYQGDQDKAMELYEQCLKLQRETDDKEGLASTLNNMANTLSYQGNISRALELYFESLKIHEAMNDMDGMAGAYNNIATTYMMQRDSAKALEYVQKSIGLLEKTKNLYGLAFAYSNVGVIYRDRKDFTTAREYFQKSISCWDEMHSDNGKPFALQNLGYILQKQAEKLSEGKEKDSLFTAALDYMKKSLKMSSEKNDLQGTASILGYLGNCYLAKGDLSEAKLFGRQALDSAKKSGFPPIIRNAAELLYKVYRKEQKWSDALSMHELFVKMRDSIFNAETQKSTLKQQMRYDYEKKEAIAAADHQKELAIAEEGKKRQQIVSWAVALGLLLVVIFSVIIFNRLRITRKQKIEIEHQKKIVEVKNKHITDSINYAKRIQDSILPSKEELAKCFSDYFIFFQPKEIVSGDFYWVSRQNEKTVLAIADCTGHGVPGAFMSMIGNTLLNEIVNEQKIVQPAEILNHLNEGIVQALHQESRSMDDGMDISVCLFEKNKITFAGANHSLYVVSNGSLEEIKGDIYSIGSAFGKKDFSFSQKEISLLNNSTLYFSTDGLPDQLGGSSGKKFLSKNLQKLLLSVSGLDVNQQEEKIRTAFNEWRGNYVQLDDVLLAGIKI